jgi:uncharacterized protein YcfL
MCVQPRGRLGIATATLLALLVTGCATPIGVRRVSEQAVYRQLRNRIKLIIDSQMVITESHGGDQVAERSDAGRCVV